MGRRGHSRLIYGIAPRGPWSGVTPTVNFAGQIVILGGVATFSITVDAGAGMIIISGGTGYTSPVAAQAGTITILGGTAVPTVSVDAAAGLLVLTGGVAAVSTSVAAVAAAITVAGGYAIPVFVDGTLKVYARAGLVTIAGGVATCAYAPHWRLVYEPMIYEAQLIRSRVAPGGQIVWRLWAERAITDGGAYIPLLATAPTDIAERTFKVETSGDVSMPKYRNGGEYTGDMSDTALFGAGGGAVAFTFTDTPHRTILNGVITIPSSVDTVRLNVYPNVSADAFERRGGLSGELVMQKMMQVEDSDEEEYLEDMVNAGWNMANVLQMMERLDKRLLRLERPEI